MNYVINPIIFYLIDVADAVRILSIAGMGLAFLIFIVAFPESMNEENNIIAKKYFKRLLIVETILVSVFVAVPGEETCYKMLIASQVTDKNIEVVESTIKESVDYIFEKLGK